MYVFVPLPAKVNIYEILKIPSMVPCVASPLDLFIQKSN